MNYSKICGHISQTAFALLFSLLTPCMLLAAQPSPAPLTEIGNTFVEPSQIEALLDSSGDLTFEDISTSPWRERFQSRADKGLNFGVTKDAVWLRFTLHNPTPLRDWILLVDNPRLQHVELFLHTPAGKIQHMRSGDEVSPSARPLPGREVAFPLVLKSGKNLDIYARITTTAPLTTPLQVVTLRQYHDQTNISAVILSGIIGAMLLLFATAVLSLWKYPKAPMLAFTVMVFVQMVYVLVQDGLSTEYLWPDHPEWTTRVKFLFISLLAPVALYYSSLTLNFRDYAPRIRQATIAVVVLGIASSILSIWLPGQLTYMTATWLSAITATLLLGAIPYVWLRGNREARTFFLSGLPLILSALSVVAHNFALIRLSTSSVFLMYKLAYLFFIATQLLQTRGRLRLEQSEALSQSQKMRVWREMSAELESIQASTQPPGNSSLQIPMSVRPHVHSQPVRIRTLGRCEVWRDGSCVRFANRGVPRQQIMLALVLAGGTRGISRTAIQDTLWPDSDGDLAEKSFRTTLYRLRQVIGGDVLQQSAATLSLNTEVAWAENIAFEELAAGLIQEIKSKPAPHVIEQALATIQLYEGDFLPGFDAPPIVAQREHLRRIFHDLIKLLAEHHIAKGDVHTAQDIYRLGLSHSQPTEVLYQGLLRCYLALGQSTEGLAAYERCRTFLLEHFHVQPSAESARLKSALANHQALPSH